MISLLKSKSDLFNSRAIYVSADKLSVHHWTRGELTSSYLFDINSEGQANFKRYLEESENSPMYILVDIVEEEFRQDTIPHVFGADRNALIKRKQSRLFRDSEYQYAEPQGREEDGRRDDKLLFMALTNNELLKPWLLLLEEYKVPVQAILSLPLLLKSYIQTLPNISDYALIVSMQSISGLRQTFFLKKQLKISRLSKLPRFGTESYAPKIKSEIDKIQRYLNSLRLVPNDTNLDVYVLADRKTLDEFDREKPTLPNINYRYLNVQEQAALTGLQIEKTIPFSDQLFLSHLLKNPPSNYYASDHDLRYAKMRKMRIGMNFCSVLVVFFSLIYSGYGITDGLVLKQQSDDAKIKTAFYQSRYNMAKERLPQTPVDSFKIKTAVEAAEKLTEYKATPYDMLSVIGQNLSLYPEIQLDDIDWVFSIKPYSEESNDTDNTFRSQKLDIDIEQKFKYFQISNIQAHISPFDGDYRKAIATVNNFVETLRGQEQVYKVTITSLPLDISSTANLQGTADVTGKEALFTLETILGVK